MIYHHLRNATAVIELGDQYILIDPMLGDVASIEAFTKKRFPPHRNPLVELPGNADELLGKVSHVLITHQHPDHLDEAGIDFIKENNLTVTCSVLDAETMKAKDLTVVQALEYNEKAPFFGGSIKGIPAQHGYGKVSELMGNVMGFYILFPDEPSLYLASDTILTKDVEFVIANHQPAVSVIASGSARLDEHEPILMTEKDILKFIKLNTGFTICNHLEALNHCPTSRNTLSVSIETEKVMHKVWIPEDGTSKQFKSKDL